jgi:hypothetical protein
MQTIIPLVTLDKPAHRAYKTIHWQPHLFSINKNTFQSVVNFKLSGTFQTGCLAWFSFQVIIYAEGALYFISHGFYFKLCFS